MKIRMTTRIMIFIKGRVQKLMFYNYEEQDDNKDSDYYQGQDASSNGEQRRKIIFARHFSSIGNFFNICLGNDYFWPTTH